MMPTHIAVEGAIGVGKTTLVRRLARHVGAREILEDSTNPFLEDFYAGKPGAAFQCQVYCLLTRYRQQRELVQEDLFHTATVADHIFHKDKIFAYLNLDLDDLAVYERLFQVLVEQVPRPDCVIYLQAPDDVLWERIRKRHRRSEERISREYVSELNKAYDYFFFHYTETPLLVVNASHVDFSTDEAEFLELVRQVESMQGGTRHYVPVGGSR